MIEQSDLRKIDSGIEAIGNSIAVRKQISTRQLFMFSRHIWLRWCLSLGLHPEQNTELLIDGASQELSLCHNFKDEVEIMHITSSSVYRTNVYEIYRSKGITGLKHTGWWAILEHEPENEADIGKICFNPLTPQRRLYIAQELRDSHLLGIKSEKMGLVVIEMIEGLTKAPWNTGNNGSKNSLPATNFISSPYPTNMVFTA